MNNIVRVIKKGRSMKSLVIYVGCYYCTKPILKDKREVFSFCDECELKKLKELK